MSVSFMGKFVYLPLTLDTPFIGCISFLIVPFSCLIWVFEVESLYVAQAGLELCLPAFISEVIDMCHHSQLGILTHIFWGRLDDV